MGPFPSNQRPASSNPATRTARPATTSTRPVTAPVHTAMVAPVPVAPIPARTVNAAVIARVRAWQSWPTGQGSCGLIVWWTGQALVALDRTGPDPLLPLSGRRLRFGGGCHGFHRRQGHAEQSGPSCSRSHCSATPLPGGPDSSALRPLTPPPAMAMRLPGPRRRLLGPSATNPGPEIITAPRPTPGVPAWPAPHPSRGRCWWSWPRPP